MKQKGIKFHLDSKPIKITLGKETLLFVDNVIGIDEKEGLCQIELDNSYGIVHKSGLIINPRYDSIQQFDKHLFKTQLNGKYGLISLYKNDLIPEIYDDITNLDNNYIAANKENIWYILNLDGEIGYGFRATSIGTLSEGICSYFLDGKWGYVLKEGYLVTKNVYDTALPFKDGLATVIVDGVKRKINTDGFYVS